MKVFLGSVDKPARMISAQKLIAPLSKIKKEKIYLACFFVKFAETDNQNKA